MSLKEKIQSLYREQCESWPELHQAVEDLASVHSKTIQVGSDNILVQFNPRRAASTLAKIDKETIAKRACFLCQKNLPEAQHGLVWKEKYIILCNPRPIFPQHFTVSSLEHTPQVMDSDAFLKLAAELHDEYVVLFNGAKAGASAPDHLHFQLAPADLMPILKKVPNDVTLNQISFAGCRYHLIVTQDCEQATQRLNHLLQESDAVQSGLVNVLAVQAQGLFKIIVVLRSAHRPSCYFTEEEDKRIMVSPASVEMGGLLVTAREQDFNALDAEKAAKIYREVVAD